MDNKIIYHGSNMKVEIPKIMINGYYKDFGYGFYCTNLKKQAIRWAMTKKVIPLSIRIPIREMRISRLKHLKK